MTAEGDPSSRRWAGNMAQDRDIARFWRIGDENLALAGAAELASLVSTVNHLWRISAGRKFLANL